MKLIETRRGIMGMGAGLATLLLSRPALAASDPMTKAIMALTGNTQINPGKVRINIPPLVENGNSVQLSVTVESPMSLADHVTRIAIFNEKNPQPEVAMFRLGPRSGQARVSTRIRLATSQKLVAIAEMKDGSFWSDSVDVVVTIAACTEES